jgi:hypothetical protein
VGIAELFVLDNLDPIVVRIKKESDILHAPIGETLLPVDAERLETRASSVEVVYGNT